MAVSLRLRATTPPRGRGAFNPIPAHTPMGATGGVVTRAKVAVYGTQPVPLRDPSRSDSIESRSRRNTVRTSFNPTWSILYPHLVGGLPRLPHRQRPTTVAVGTSIGPPGGVAPQPRGRVRRRTGAMTGRVTQAPHPTVVWRKQGRRGAPKATEHNLGKMGVGPTHHPREPKKIIKPYGGLRTERYVGGAPIPRGPTVLPRQTSIHTQHSTAKIRSSQPGPTGMATTRRGSAHIYSQAVNASYIPQPRKSRPHVRAHNPRSR